jgi:putative glutamine amidotransferase
VAAAASTVHGAMDRAPRIGICAALEQARWTHWDERAFLLSENYVRAIQRAGGVALMIPDDPRLVAEPDLALDAIDGLVLAGGADVDPGAYGAESHPETNGTNPARDATEIALARRALERDMPVLGICRGMQVLNVAAGGTLTQHLPDDLGHSDHRRSLGSFDNADHDVRLEQGSLAARAAGETIHATKSHHHQAIAEPGDGLVITGWATIDDLPEAIERPGCRFALGVQWHPEVDPSSDVVAALVEAARS